LRAVYEAIRAFVVFLLIVSCVSCMSAPVSPVASRRSSEGDAERVRVEQSTLAKPFVKSEEIPAPEPEKKPTDSGTLVEIPPLGRQEMAKKAITREALPFSDARKVQVTFEAMPMNDFVNHIFGDVFGVSYVAGDEVNNNKKPISLDLKEAAGERRLFDLVEEVLAREGVRIVYKDKVFYLWTQGKEGKPADVVLGVGRSTSDIPESSGEIIQLVPIQYADAMELLGVLKNVMNLNLQQYSRENIISIRGARRDIMTALNFIEIMDRPALRGRHVAMVSLKNLTPEEFIATVHPILYEEGIPVARAPGQVGILFMPVDRLGAVLVFASEKSWLARVKSWLALLDVASQSEEKAYHIYTPDYATAEDLANALAALLGLEARPQGQTTKSQRGGAYSQSPLTSGGVGFGAPAASDQPAASGQTGVAQTGSGGWRQKGQQQSGAGGDKKGVMVAHGPDMSFAIDGTRNALIFFTTGRTYEKVRSLLVKLDRMPPQVTLQALIVEITLTDSFSFGMNWTLKDGSVKLGTSSSLVPSNGVLNFVGSWGNNELQIKLSALAKENLVKVLSRPTLTVRDGRTASINVGQEVPILSQQATNTSSSTEVLQSIQYRNTGVILQVKPTINARGVVTLEISQEVSEASTNTSSDIDSPIILNRQVVTEVVAGDGQTVVLGGLIRENKSTAQTGVPGLRKIPFLGPLFRTDSKTLERTELVVFLTPRIIQSQEQTDSVRDDILKGFSNLWFE